MNTWTRWCEQIGGVDLDKKYNRLGGVFSVRFDAPAIGADFVRRFNAGVVQDAAEQQVGAATASDAVVQKLVELKMLGVWHENATLHWANTLLEENDELGVHEFSDLSNAVQHGLQRYRAAAAKLPAAELCLWGTIDTVFERLTLHGPDQAIETVTLRHTLADSR